MRVAKLKEAYPIAKVELWSEDEHRLGLKPIIRKVWSPIGQRPIVKVHQRYEWTYLYAFFVDWDRLFAWCDFLAERDGAYTLYRPLVEVLRPHLAGISQRE